MRPPAALSNRPTAPSPGLVAPATGLTPPSRRVAAARNRYRTDGTTGMTGGRLLVALYQRLLSDLVGAETAIEANQIESAHLQLVHAQEIVDSLEDALDPTAWDQAERMVSLYAHLRRELIAANVTKNAAAVVRCRRIVEPMAQTWQEALDLTTTTPVPSAVAASGVGS